jgi:hypothetical protein
MRERKFITVGHLPDGSFRVQRKITENNPKPGSILLNPEQYEKLIALSRPCVVYLFDQREDEEGPVSVIRYD